MARAVAALGFSHLVWRVTLWNQKVRPDVSSVDVAQLTNGSAPLPFAAGGAGGAAGRGRAGAALVLLEAPPGAVVLPTAVAVSPPALAACADVPPAPPAADAAASVASLPLDRLRGRSRRRAPRALAWRLAAVEAVDAVSGRRLAPSSGTCGR